MPSPALLEMFAAYPVAVSTPPVAGYIGWWDASVTADITGGGAVSAWNDKSGNNYHFAQSSAGAKPASGTRSQNGLNVIDFDGSADFMEAPTGAQTQPNTLFVVALVDSTSGQQVMVDGVTQGGSTAVYQSSAAKWTMYAGGPADLGNTGSDTSAHVHSAVFNTTSSERFVDGVSSAAGNAGTRDPTNLRVGALGGALGSYWNGWIGEILFYASALNTTNRQSVEAYLKAKWGTP